MPVNLVNNCSVTKKTDAGDDLSTHGQTANEVTISHPPRPLPPKTALLKTKVQQSGQANVLKLLSVGLFLICDSLLRHAQQALAI